MDYARTPSTEIDVSRIGLGIRAIDAILAETIRDPIGPQFMAPPSNGTDAPHQTHTETRKLG